MQVLGIDIGGSGIKGAIVDVEKGELVTTPSHSHAATFDTQGGCQGDRRTGRPFRVEGAYRLYISGHRPPWRRQDRCQCGSTLDRRGCHQTL